MGFHVRTIRIQILILKSDIVCGGGTRETSQNAFLLDCHQKSCINARHRPLFLRIHMHARDSQQPEMTIVSDHKKTFLVGLSRCHCSYTTWSTPESENHKCRQFVSHISASIWPWRVKDEKGKSEKVQQTYGESNGSHGNTLCELSTRYETLSLMNSLFLQRSPFGAPATVSPCHRWEFTST